MKNNLWEIGKFSWNNWIIGHNILGKALFFTIITTLLIIPLSTNFYKKINENTILKQKGWGNSTTINNDLDISAIDEKVFQSETRQIGHDLFQNSTLSTNHIPLAVDLFLGNEGLFEDFIGKIDDKTLGDILKVTENMLEDLFYGIPEELLFDGAGEMIPLLSQALDLAVDTAHLRANIILK